MPFSHMKFGSTAIAAIFFATLQTCAVTAFAPSFNTLRVNTKMYNEIEDTAQSLFFAQVGKKDHLGPDFAKHHVKDAAEAPASDNKAAEQKKVKKPNRWPSNKKANDPKPYYKKNGNTNNPNSKKKNLSKPMTKKVKSAPALPLIEVKVGSTVKGRVEENGKKPVMKKVKSAPALPLVKAKSGSAVDGRVKKNGKKPVTKKVKHEPALPLIELKLGSTVEGRVAAFTDFGVFIKINYDLKSKGNGGYALLHNSQIRDEPVLDAQKLFRIGNAVKGLRVITVNYQKGEVGLSLRDQRDKRKSLSEFEVGQEYTGKVARVVPYGAFIDVGAKANALLHISRINQKKIESIRNWVNEGDTVTVRIIDKDEKKNTLAASMLDKESDEYLNKRTAQLQRMRQRSEEKSSNASENGLLKSELEYFNDAVKELEDALE